MADRDFFESKNPQAVLKHGLLTRYAHYFAGRAGHATGGRIAFIDGYSGAGRYRTEVTARHYSWPAAPSAPRRSSGT